MKQLKVDNKRVRSRVNIPEAEKLYNAKYVGEFSVKSNSGNWLNKAVSVFYEKDPPLASMPNYFGLEVDLEGKVWIVDATSAVSGLIDAVVDSRGTVYYSSHESDYTVAPEGGAFIDGGRARPRFTLSRHLYLRVDEGELVVMETEETLRFP